MSWSTHSHMAAYNLQGSLASQDQPFNLEGLAPEIQHMIFEYALLTDDNKALRSLAERTDTYSWQTLHNTALLRVSRSIHEQALPILYAVNRFHHSVSHDVEPAELFIDAPLFLMHLHNMRSVSLNFSGQYYCRYDQVVNNEYAGELVSIYLKHLYKYCIHLRHLSLQFMLPPPTIYLHPAADLEETDLPCKEFITAALLELKPRLETLTIVEYGDLDIMEEFCSSIAARDEWVRGTSRSWGEESLREDFVDVFGDWEQGIGIGCSEICVYRWRRI